MVAFAWQSTDCQSEWVGAVNPRDVAAALGTNSEAPAYRSSSDFTRSSVGMVTNFHESHFTRMMRPGR